MFTTFLLPLPPPSTSLLPTFLHPSTEQTQQTHLHHQHSRRKPASRSNNPLTLLSHDIRLRESRKVAIAMYGYSWLKPAGCNKTMLGRREEELEREEVERQMREVELQERMAMEQEEQERREELRQQAEDGEVEGVGERDLDDEVPEAERDGSEEEPEDEDEEDEEEDMDGDLDDGIPEVDGHESSWVYDTRRESDTESEDEGSNFNDRHNDAPTNSRHPRAIHPLRPGSRHYAEQDDPAATEAIVNAMLDEDELGEYEHQGNYDLDDVVPHADMDMEIDMDANLSDQEANLDDDVHTPDSEPGWEHTDSEVEESEMDISLLPPHPSSSSRNPGTTHEEMRRVSGNSRRMLPLSLPPPTSHQSSHSSRGPPRQRQREEQQEEPQRQPQPRTAPRRKHPRAMVQTPETADEVSALISTGAAMSTRSVTTGPMTEDSIIEPQVPTNNRRSWLNPAGARRNLFGGFRTGGSTATDPSSAATQAQDSQSQIQGQAQLQRPSQAQTRTAAWPTRTTAAATGVRSGGLFTPSPRLAATGSDDEDQDEEQVAEQTRGRTRSGRLLGGLGVRRARRGRDGEI